MGNRRFLTGALVAGLVSNISGLLLAHLVLGNEVDALLQRVGRLPPWAPFLHVATRLVAAAAAFWILVVSYRALANLFRAIVLTAAVAWLLLYPIPLQLYSAFKAFQPPTISLAGVWGFVELLVAVACGWAAQSVITPRRRSGPTLPPPSGPPARRPVLDLDDPHRGSDLNLIPAPHSSEEDRLPR